MTTTSPRFALTIPNADGSDPADLAALLRALGLDVENNMPGITALATAARTALTGVAKFAGRTVFDTGDNFHWATDGTSWWPLAKLAADKSLPMGGQKITGLGAGTSATDAATKAQLDAAMPVGAVIAYAGPSAPAGWALCDGAAVSRTTYADLFAAIGATHGAGNGSTTFNLPDLRGRFLLGAGSGPGLTARANGGKAGTETHQLTTAEMPSHSHGGGITGEDTPDHGHTVPLRQGGSQSNSGGTDGYLWHNDSSLLINGATVRHRHSIASEGGGGAHNNMPPFYTLTYIIKTN